MLQAEDAHAAHLVFVNQCLEGLARELEARGAPVTAAAASRSLRRAARRRALRIWSHVETGNGITYAGTVRSSAGAGVPASAGSRSPGTGWSGPSRAATGGPPLGGLRPTTAGPAAGAHRPRGSPAPGACATAVAAPASLDSGARAPARRRAVARLGLASSFLTERGVDYPREMSSPSTAWNSCSRLSPHLAWGTLSVRQVFQLAERRREDLALARRRGRPVDGRWRGSIEAFGSRLRWHCHFIQKLESEPEIEFECMNRALARLRGPELDPDRFAAWAEGGRGGRSLTPACGPWRRRGGWPPACAPCS